MGGDGSGRPRNAEKHVIKTYEAMNENAYGVFIPNLSGVQNEIKAGTHNITTDDLAEGSTNLYSLFEIVDDYTIRPKADRNDIEGVGSFIANSMDVDEFFSDYSELGTVGVGVWNGTPLTANYVPNHDDLNGFVANEHIDWTNATQNLTTTGNVGIGTTNPSAKLHLQGSSGNLLFVTKNSDTAATTGFQLFDGTNVEAAWLLRGSTFSITDRQLDMEFIAYHGDINFWTNNNKRIEIGDGSTGKNYLWVVNDNQTLLFGAGKDAGIWYDGSDLHIDAQLVGSGTVVIDNLPTSASGLPTGGLWNNGGVLNVA